MKPRVNSRATLERRFWAKVNKTDDCWIWTAQRTKHGYGQVRQNKVSRMAHRVAYEWLVGPIPEGLVIDHLCENPACVNPAHLEPVTNSTNVIRAYGGTCRFGHPLDGYQRSGQRLISRYCTTCKKAKRKARQHAR